VAVLATLAAGCGSTSGDDALVMQFVRWDSESLTQSDQVRESSADVDVVQDCCMFATDGSCEMAEPITQTVINAVFRNQEAADIHMDSYVVHFNDSRSGVADYTGSLSAVLQGGRCASASMQTCVVDADCGLSGSCVHTNTSVNGIVLFDFLTKAAVNPAIYGQATSITVTFFASDPNQSLTSAVGYVATFGDFDNCQATTGGA